MIAECPYRSGMAHQILTVKGNENYKIRFKDIYPIRKAHSNHQALAKWSALGFA